MQSKQEEYQEEVARAREIMQKIGHLVKEVGKVISDIVKIVATYKGIKEALEFVQSLSEKTQLIAAASAPSVTAGPFAALGFLKRFGAKSAIKLSFMAGNALAYIEGAELTMLVFGKKVLNNISKAVTKYFGVKAARTVRAEKWGRALDDDVIRASQEYHDAADAAADAEWEYDFAAQESYEEQMERLIEEETNEAIAAAEAAAGAINEEILDLEGPSDEETDTSSTGNPGYPFIQANYNASPFGSHGSAAVARNALANAKGFSSYGAYKTDRDEQHGNDSLTVRKSEWDSTSSAW